MSYPSNQYSQQNSGEKKVYTDSDNIRSIVFKCRDNEKMLKLICEHLGIQVPERF